MPWLADLVQSSVGSLDALPLQCLCEFLLMKHPSGKQQQQNKLRSIKLKVAGRLQDLLIGEEATSQSCTDLVQYFINRWSSLHLKDREAAVYGFKTIVLHKSKQQKINNVEEESAAAAVDTDDKNQGTITTKQSVIKTSNEHHQEKNVGQNDPDSYVWLHETLLEFPFIDSVLPLLLAALRQVSSSSSYSL